MSVDVQLDRLACARPCRRPCPVSERVTRGEGEQWTLARVRRKVRRQLVNDHLTERHRPGALECLRWPDPAGRKPLPLNLDSAPQEVHIRDLQTERLTDPKTRPGEQHHERPIARLDGAGQSCDLLDGRDNDLWPIVT